MKVLLLTCFVISRVLSAPEPEASTNLTLLYSWKVPFVGGIQKGFSHYSFETKSVMRFAIYLPPSVGSGKRSKLPVVYFLPGSSCNEETIFLYTLYWRYAAKYDVVVVSTDTSPRGLHLPGEKAGLVGEGEGWFLDASTDIWKDHYRMHSYVTKELPQLIDLEFRDFIWQGRKSIMGHSMGGHGSVVLSLRNPGLYVTATAFAPCLNPTQQNKTAFHAYLGSNKEVWKEWDASFLIEKYKGPDLHLRVDQGTADTQVTPESSRLFREGAERAKIPVDFRWRKGWGHVLIVPKFIGDHFKHHSELLYKNSSSDPDVSKLVVT